MFLQCQMPQMMLALTATEGLTPVSSYSHIPIGLLRIHNVDQQKSSSLYNVWTVVNFFFLHKILIGQSNLLNH